MLLTDSHTHKAHIKDWKQNSPTLMVPGFFNNDFNNITKYNKNGINDNDNVYVIIILNNYKMFYP